MAIGGTGVVNAVLRGADLVMITSNVNLGTQRIMAIPAIKTPKDLTGRRVGVSGFGSNTHSTLLMLLRRWSIDTADLTIVPVGPSPTMLISLQKGWIDAAVVTAPTDFAAEDLGFRTLADVGDMKFYTLQSTITTKRDYLRAQEAQVVKFVKGYSEVVASIKKNKSVAIAVLKKRLRMDDSQLKYLDKTYQRYASVYLDRIPYVASAGVQNLLEYLERENPKAIGADPSMFTDLRVVKNLEQSGFYKSLYR